MHLRRVSPCFVVAIYHEEIRHPSRAWEFCGNDDEGESETAGLEQERGSSGGVVGEQRGVRKEYAASASFNSLIAAAMAARSSNNLLPRSLAHRCSLWQPTR